MPNKRVARLRLSGWVLACLTWISSAQAQTPPVCDPVATICAGLPCEQLGKTTLDHDGKNIIACLNPETGTQKIWKTMTSPVGASADKAIIGGFEIVYREGTGAFGYCRLAWGSGSCASGSCAKGTAVVTGMSYDKIGSAEDLSAGKVISSAGGGHIGHFSCVQ